MSLCLTSACDRYATKKFKREGIRLLTLRHVERVEDVSFIMLSSQCNFLTFSQGKMFVKEEGEGLDLTFENQNIVLTWSSVPFGLLVWSTGLAPNPLIESITEVQKDPKTKRYAPSHSLVKLHLDMFEFSRCFRILGPTRRSTLTSRQSYHRRTLECHHEG